MKTEIKSVQQKHIQLMELKLVNNHYFPLSGNVEGAKSKLANWLSAETSSINTSQKLWRDKSVKDIKDAKTAIRNAINPKNNNDGLFYIAGRYLVTFDKLIPITQKVEFAISKYKEAVREFVQNWDQHIQDAKVFRGNGFDSSQYPDPTTLLSTVEESIFLTYQGYELMDTQLVDKQYAEDIQKMNDSLVRKVNEGAQDALVDAVLALATSMQGERFHGERHIEKVNAAIEFVHAAGSEDNQKLKAAAKIMDRMVNNTKKEVWDSKTLREERAKEIVTELNDIIL